MAGELVPQDAPQTITLEGPITEPGAPAEPEYADNPEALDLAAEAGLEAVPPTAQEAQRRMERRFYEKTREMAAQRVAMQREVEAAQRRAEAAEARARRFSGYDRFAQADEMVANNPEMAEQARQMIPGFEAGMPKWAEALVSDIAQQANRRDKDTLDRALETMRDKHEDFEAVGAAVIDEAVELGIIRRDMEYGPLMKGLRRLYQAHSSELKPTVKGKAAAQRELVERAEAARRLPQSGGTAARVPSPEPSSFSTAGRLKSWSEIRAEARRLPR